MSDYIDFSRLKISPEFHEFVLNELLEGLDLSADSFWSGLEKILSDLSDENRRLLGKRAELQQALNDWHTAHPGPVGDLKEYSNFLQDIGYLLPEGEDFEIDPGTLDAEVSKLAGPQLVVPVSNARYALNAANARWGSLYDALYGSDIIPWSGEAKATKGYDAARGAAVIQYVRDFLDEALPLNEGRHRDVLKYELTQGGVRVHLPKGEFATFRAPDCFVGYDGDFENPSSLLFQHHGLHIEFKIDPASLVGQQDKAGLSDVWMEAALSVIMDGEDSVAAVNPVEKVGVYKNWLKLMQGNLVTEFDKGGKTVVRNLNEDRQFKALDDTAVTLKGRSLMLVRNVGHLMTSDLVLFDGEEAFEGIIDGVVTSVAAMHDLQGKSRYSNSNEGTIYIVKPKMHGPEEVAFASRLFSAVEGMLGLAPNTIKMGVMDEERRTSLNLKEAIRAAKDRIFFINTGFLDRTGDEIHSIMQAGAVVRKGDMKAERWIDAYERSNVIFGLKSGFQGRAQIGKGMWAKPDEMAEMMVEKINHPLSGATTAWVPSPTAATLHALHYHMVDVAGVQDQMLETVEADEASLRSELLHLPLAIDQDWSQRDIQEELRQNAQSILGYVVRWVDQGVGCSKVPDINNVGLMEDRATLRISSQHIANWLHHGICTKDDVWKALKEMAVQVDRQNGDDPVYHPMAPDFDNSLAFQAASDLIFKGSEQPSGYTEPLLHAYRRQVLGNK